MASFNLVVLAGHLTRDPEIRYTPKGTGLANFSLAVNRKWKSEAGDEREEVAFIDCEAWSKTAEIIGQYLKKGSAALIQGRIKQDTWDDKQTGQKRSRLKIVVETVQFLPSAQGATGRPEASARPTTAAASPAARAPDDDTPSQDDDVPF